MGKNKFLSPDSLQYLINNIPFIIRHSEVQNDINTMNTRIKALEDSLSTMVNFASQPIVIKQRSNSVDIRWVLNIPMDITAQIVVHNGGTTTSILPTDRNGNEYIGRYDVDLEEDEVLTFQIKVKTSSMVIISNVINYTSTIEV